MNVFKRVRLLDRRLESCDDMLDVADGVNFSRRKFMYPEIANFQYRRYVLSVFFLRTGSVIQ